MKVEIRALQNFCVGPHTEVCIAAGQHRIIDIAHLGDEFATTPDKGTGSFVGCNLARGWQVVRILINEFEQPVIDAMHEFLNGCGCVDLVPVKIKLGKQTFLAIEYRQGVEDTATRYYIAGELPLGYRSGSDKRDGTKFIAEDGNTYYIAAYMPASRINENNSMHHPIGANFLIFESQHGWHNPVNELPISFERLDS